MIPLKKELNALRKNRFDCASDAEAEAQRWISKQPYHRFKDLRIAAVSVRIKGKRGRPKKDEPVQTKYVVEAEVEIDEVAVAKHRRTLGRFVLATNKLDLDPEVILSYYKGQQTVERGFRFLKDRCFHVSEIYLKKEERIESLSMIMVLNLLIYSFGEWMLRERLKETGLTVPNQLNKPTQRPTLRWVFTLFMGVVKATLMDGMMFVGESTNLNEVQRGIISLLGPDCQKYYGE